MKKNLRRVIVSLIALLPVLYSWAQSNAYKVDLPQLLPPSPEAYAFVKAGVGNVNMSTGAASASIPLYTIKVRDFAFPLSLSYSTQGLKADEASSRVGYGWVLNATAMITRSVKGKPDEYTNRMNMLTDFGANVDSVINYYMDASSSTSGGDSQPDEFQFNCNGYSGKFVLDNNYVPRVTATSNVKINMQLLVTPNSTAGYIGIITITTPDGVKYSFGTTYERTITYNIPIADPFKNVTKTAFFLDKIELPTGEYINFNYTAIQTKAITGTIQTLQLVRSQGEISCGDCSSRNSYTSQDNWVQYATFYLSNITTSTGLSVNLAYEARNDNSGDNRLQSLIVEGIKQYRFNYYDVPIPSGTLVTTGRFFLTKVREVKMTDDVINPDSSYDYVLTYNNLDQVPQPITFSQDYFGYYNGSNSNYFIPPSLNSNNTMDFSFRGPNWMHAKKGTLSSIQYPTGGKQEFFYEPNTTGSYITVYNSVARVDLAGNGTTGGSFAVYYSDYISVLKDQTATLSASADDAILDDGISSDPSHNTVILKLYDGATVVASRSVMGYALTSTTVSLLAGHTYRMELTVKVATDIGFGTLSYDPTSPGYSYTFYQEKEIPGIRVKQIKSTDPATGSTYSKYYKYTTLADLQASTGGEYGIPDFTSTANVRTFCGDFGAFETNCTLDIYSSSSTNDVYSIPGSGSLIYYNTVLESDDPNFINGGTEYNFSLNESGSNHQLMFGEEIPYLQAGQYPTLSGAVQSKRTFNKDKQIVQEEINEYETLIDMANATNAVYVRKKYEPFPGRPDRLLSFDVDKSTYANYWIRQKSTTVKNYAGSNILTTKTDNTYGTAANILPASVSTVNSKGQTVKTDTKYPTDFAGDAVNDKLIARNIIMPAIEQSSYNNGVLLQQKKVKYRDWFNDNKILLPDTVRVKQSPTDALSEVLLFDKYDVSGNILQLKKANNIPVVYLWDVAHGLPLCEATNAVFDQVAFSGFETGTDYGNWQLNSGAVNQAAAFTGGYSFTGSLSKTISIAGTYIVRLWTNSSATVNSASGSLLKTSRGWNLYEWKLTNPSSITVQGTNIDDLRLRPLNASMVTYTHTPFIGPTSKSDDNGNLAYYEYDPMGRLAVVRDIDKNVIKNYEYQYVTNNDTKLSVWQPLDATRCKPCELNASYNSTIQQQQVKDISPQSSTYNQVRWADIGTGGSCTVNAVWQNTATAPRCAKDAGNFNTGIQEQERVDVNPCSSTYNQTRWFSLGTNYTSCPLACPDCTTIDKKCINGVCVTGTPVFVSSTQVSFSQWNCTWHYQFSDGTFSANYIVVSSTPCQVD